MRDVRYGLTWGFAGVLLFGYWAGCSSNTPETNGTGGVQGTGGISATGGFGVAGQTTGGTVGTGGVVASTGGQSGTGGTVNTGGSNSTTGCGSLPDFLVSKYHPTSASSTASDSLSGFINDGDISAPWTATASDNKAWCWVALEQAYDVDSVELTFPGPGNYRYTIDTSTDGTTWKKAVDQSTTTSTEQIRCATGKLGSGVQWVRVSFVGLPAGKPAALTEISVGGTLTD